MNDNVLKIIPLGGIEEIGKNATFFQYQSDALVIDCGLKFANRLTELGVDNSYIDFEYIQTFKDKIKALVITHAHLDHIGGVAYFIARFPKVPIYCTAFSKGMIERIINNYPKKLKPIFKMIVANVEYKVGNLSFEFVATNHSITDSFSIYIKSPVGKVFHTGDFRIDNSIEGEEVDFNRIEEISKEEVDILLCDSTNATNKNLNQPEKEIIEEIANIIDNAKDRVIIALFSTQVNRIKEIIKHCKKTGKKIFIAGRSLQNVVELSLELKIIKEKDIFISMSEISQANKKNLVILTTGTQGEPSSGLQLMSEKKHRFIQLLKTDIVILSSSFIPGNEKIISEMLNKIAEKEVQLITYKDRNVHVSGHASREEIRYLFNKISPKYFIPIHGEVLHLMANKKIAMEEGMKEKNILLVKNGYNIQINIKGTVSISEKHKMKIYYKDGKLISLVSKEIFEERRELMNNGVIHIRVLRKKKKEVLLDIKSKGFVDRNNSKRVLKEFKEDFKSFLSKEFEGNKIKGKEEISIKKFIRNNLYFKTGKNPTLFFDYIEQEAEHSRLV